MGVNNKWTRQETYSRKLVENATQAIARDILTEAMFRLEKSGFEIVGHVHDEVIMAEPVSVAVDCFGTEYQDLEFIQAYVRENYDLTPKGIVERLHLLDVDYSAVSFGGHFGKGNLPWEM